MSFRTNRNRTGGRCAAVYIGLTCMSLLVCAPATADSEHNERESDPVVVVDTPTRLPHKHRTVKPGVAKPKAYISKPLPLVKSLRQSRSGS